MALITCRLCNYQFSDQAKLCPKCGHPNHFLPKHNKTIAGFLALLLGGLGLHKFYLGQVFWGVFYMVFCWTFIPAIISFFEAISIFSMSEENFRNTYEK